MWLGWWRRVTRRQPMDDRSRYRDVKEADWQQQVIDTLHLHGWRVAHFRTAMTARGNYVTPVQADGAGFPDLIAVHPATGDVLVAELKAEYRQATPLQLQWLEWFYISNVDGYIWRPSDVDRMIERV